MPATPEAQAKTRAFARVLGPDLVILPGLIVAKLNEVAPLAAPFFANQALVFIMGALMVFGGICVIANHQIWRGASAILISLFGWFICLRGLALLLAPQAYEHLADVSQGALSPFWTDLPRRSQAHLRRMDRKTTRRAMTLANMRSLGVRSVDACCGCGRSPSSMLRRWMAPSRCPPSGYGCAVQHLEAGRRSCGRTGWKCGQEG